jgi:hypothetical protein
MAAAAAPAGGAGTTAAMLAAGSAALAASVFQALAGLAVLASAFMLGCLCARYVAFKWRRLRCSARAALRGAAGRIRSAGIWHRQQLLAPGAALVRRLLPPAASPLTLAAAHHHPHPTALAEPAPPPPAALLVRAPQRGSGGAADPGSRLECGRTARAPSEFSLDDRAPGGALRVHDTCAWLCEKRFRGYMGRYAGSYSAASGTCACVIQDCASRGAPPCAARAEVETPTDGVNIPNKAIAAAMCPLVCLMKHPGKNAEASPHWDGGIVDASGRRVAKPGVCMCIVDACAA